VRLRAAAAAAALAAAALAASMAHESGGRVVRVYADATLRPPLEEILSSFIEDECEGDCRVVWVWGSSGYTLSRIRLDGGGDLYVADDSHFPEAGVEEGILEPGSLTVVGYVRLALIVAEGNPKNITSLQEALSREDVVVAIGNPEHVSAGVLAWRIIVENGFGGEAWDLVREGRILLAPSAAEAAAMVRLGVADAAVTFSVYVSLWPGELEEVDDLQVSTVKAPVVVALPATHGPLARSLYEYVLRNREVFWEYGVEPPES